MMGFFIFLFTVVPIVELALLIKIGQIWGITNTLVLVILTGVLGAILLKLQGMGILRRINTELSQGLLPPDALFDGFFIFCGGLLLVTPGVITDIIGILLLFPFTRNLFKNWAKRKIKRTFEQGRVIHFTYFRRYG
jgi:UPF0716 protein FxsA